MAAQHISIAITIQIALIGYAITVCLLLAGNRGKLPNRWLRMIWTMACLSFIAHVLAAFHFAYHWSHEEAVRTTARQTEELLGQAFGQGLYFNYLFLTLWIADVIYWWWNSEKYRIRSRWITLPLHGYLFFIAFNGAVIFKSGGIRVAGLISTVAIVVLAIRKLLAGTNASRLILRSVGIEASGGRQSPDSSCRQQSGD